MLRLRVTNQQQKSLLDNNKNNHTETHTTFTHTTNKEINTKS